MQRQRDYMIKGRYYVVNPRPFTAWAVKDTYLPEGKIIRIIYSRYLIYVTDIINSQWCSIRFVDFSYGEKYISPTGYLSEEDEPRRVEDRYLIEEGYGDFDEIDCFDHLKSNNKRYPLMEGYIRYRIENNYKLFPWSKADGDGTLIDNPYFKWVSSYHILSINGDRTRFDENASGYNCRIELLNEKIQKIQNFNTLWHQKMNTKNNQIAQLKIKYEQQNNTIDQQKETITQLESDVITQHNTIDQQSDQIKQQEEMINQLLIALDEKNKTVTQSIMGLFK